MNHIRSASGIVDITAKWTARCDICKETTYELAIDRQDFGETDVQLDVLDRALVESMLRDLGWLVYRHSGSEGHTIHACPRCH